MAVEFGVLTEGADVQVATWYGYFTDATFERTIESLRHCGWTGDDLADLSGLDANEVELVIEDEEYEGKTYAKVQWVNKPGGLAIRAPLTGEKAKSFAAAMRGRIQALDAAKGQRKPPPAKKGGVLSPEPPPLTENDIPF